MPRRSKCREKNSAKNSTSRRRLELQSLGKNAGLVDGKIASIRLLGSSEKVAWSQGDSALTIQPPVGGGPYAWAYRIDLQ